MDYKLSTVGRATVMGKPNVIIFRRKTSVGEDWCFDYDPGRGVYYTCANDEEGLVKDIEIMWEPE